MIKNKILSLFLIVFMIYCCFENTQKVQAYSMSKAEICIEARTGKVLHSYNEKERLSIASTTKILTCITALENKDYNDIVTITNKTTGIEGSSIYLKEGEKYSLLSLLYGLMLRSGNDSAETIADFVCGRENFIDKMNETAKKCGAYNSNFTNPHGLDNKNHYSTALDMAKITAYALKNETFKKIVSTKKFVVEEHSNNINKVYYNKNKMLSSLQGCIGVKTGFTKKSGRCLVTACERNNLTLICVVLNSPQMYERTAEIINSCYNKFSYDNVLNQE